MWFTKPKVETKVVLLNREVANLRIAEWRADPALCAKALAVLANPDLRLMLEVIANDHPAHYILRDDTPVEQRAIYQGRGEGYTLALANLRSLARQEMPPESIVEEFAETE